MRGVFLIAAFLLLVAVPPARAQQLIGEYFALLSPVDFYNSNGVRLRDFGAILQQDRANFHRFGRRDDLDQWDPVFGDAGQRARIPGIWSVVQGSEYIPGAVLSGQTRYVWVRIYGFGTVPSYILVSEGAG
ncbi:hypothetical protein N8I71_05710 [Roseibacterium sp. SDUM158016]|jgi:hypothetical protein|uniref:hypothetical protein n=1 Tax=Roseicyclus sediminis TaxID=2980997 RepID=UPI0021D10783|nr:hypothetical protein [Roseibacterium sp. SDUM158016]MCU4652316.1 hypothetical protein [Roseibacterium sp. SDUM158016]